MKERFLENSVNKKVVIDQTLLHSVLYIISHICMKINNIFFLFNVEYIHCFFTSSKKSIKPNYKILSANVKTIPKHYLKF